MKKLSATGDLLGVIDVGSNTVKALLARRGPRGDIEGVWMRTEEARLGTAFGKPGCAPAFSDEEMRLGATVIAGLAETLRARGASHVVAVATSIVREATNAPTFCEQVRKVAQIDLRVISGDEEARLACLGIASDALLEQTPRFVLADLGGGSLEIVEFAQGCVVQAVSLPLGAVRLMREYQPSPALPLDDTTRAKLGQRALSSIQGCGFSFPREPGVPLVGTGGAFTILRVLKATALGVSLEETPAFIPLNYLSALQDELCSVPLDERCRRYPALPQQRADILPAGLIVLQTLAREAAAEGYLHSRRNLRFGVAAELLP